MEERVNRRGYHETFIKGKHLKLTELKEKVQVQGKPNQYLFKENIPVYPRPEFRFTQLHHDTNALCQIALDEGGFLAASATEDVDEEEQNPKDPHHMDLLWWSLSAPQQWDMLGSAEKRLLEDAYPDRTEEQAAAQQPFLGRFASSPAFQNTSRYGSYRLTFPLEELLGAYCQQMCVGSEPILRVYETVLYKQEVMYSVVVHSHFYNHIFNKYPLLDDSPHAVCAYQDGQIIWRPEAMCGTHRFQLVHKPYQNQMVAHLLSEPKQESYVWDHVAVAFHLPDSETLNFDMNRLRGYLSFCEPGHPTVSPSEEFDSLEDAQELVEAYWPYYPIPL